MVLALHLSVIALKYKMDELNAPSNDTKAMSTTLCVCSEGDA